MVWQENYKGNALSFPLCPGMGHRCQFIPLPWGCWGLDTTERLPFHFSLSCIGEGNGNSLQCSCLENPRDRGAWWAAVYGVAQSWTRLKWLSSSSDANSVQMVSARLLHLRYLFPLYLIYCVRFFEMMHTSPPNKCNNKIKIMLK